MHYDLEIAESAKILIDLAFQEDLGDGVDLSSEILIDANANGAAQMVARDAGIACGLPLIPQIIERFNGQINVDYHHRDGDPVTPNTVVATLTGNARDLLKAERTILNFAGRLSGVATLTHEFVEQTRGTVARIYDTRKTTPGWRRLEKYAVLCGGGVNHRMGLYDAILIKDNHLTVTSDANENWVDPIVNAFNIAKRDWPGRTIQIEVDTLAQLEAILPLRPDIILLDNMTVDQLRTAVSLREDEPIQLEASGGVNLETVRGIAETGVERISVGRITHSAVNFDWGLDWK